MSLTVGVAERIATQLEQMDCSATIENIALTDFDPRFRMGDVAAYRAYAAGEVVLPPADVRRQQELLTCTDALVVVFPVYWWSFPAQLKGWADRVLTGGWAWNTAKAEGWSSAIAHLDIHFVPLAGASESHYRRHGYDTAIRTQLQHGIAEYSGARSATWAWLWNAESNPERSLDQAALVAAEVCRRVSSR